MNIQLQLKEYFDDIFGPIRQIEHENITPENTVDISYSSFGQHTNTYGDQNIFKIKTQEFIAVVNQLFDQGFNPTLPELILYAGIQRKKTAILQDDFTREMGYWKNPNGGMTNYDHLSKYRYLDSIDFLWRFLDSDLPMHEKVVFEGSICSVTYERENPVVYYFTDDGKKWSRLTFRLDEEGCNDTNQDKRCGVYFSSAGDKDFYLLLDSIYQEYLINKNLEYVARIHWYMCRRVTHLRGGGAVAEWIAAALIVHAGYEFKGWSIDPYMEPWAQAITSGIDRFVEIYPEIANL